MIQRVFLSAGVPDPRRKPVYYETADITAIRDAVRAAATAALKRGELVFGGQPAISPLVLLVARALNAVDHVHIYQSRYFEGRIPPESLAFKRVTWTDVVSTGVEPSLAQMRKQMLQAGAFTAAFFIGGMEGVEQEFTLFRTRWPHTPAYPVPSTGAAAKIIFDANATNLRFINETDRRNLQRDVAYTALFDRLLAQANK